MEGKKISFGFMKTKKADKPLVVGNEEKKEYIECVEEQSIKVVGGEEIKADAPLVIPMKPNTLVTVERLKEIAEQVESALEEPAIKQESMVDENVHDPLADNETLDQMAERELLQAAKKVEKAVPTNMAITTTAKPAAGGEKESTLDDYEAVPVQEFGMAMLRGMGWTPGKDGTKYKQPELRPKGLGLGADKVIKKKPENKDGKAEELAIVKNASVKVTAGKYSGYYGKTLSRATRAQKRLLSLYISQHPELLKVNWTNLGRNESKEEWDKLAESLNAIGSGDYRSGQQWKRYWTGLKHKVKERVLAKGEITCDIDKRVWAIIQSEYRGFSSSDKESVPADVTVKQRTWLLNYLSQHQDLVTTNGLETSKQTSLDQEWEIIAKTLNAKNPEARKSAEQWKVYWLTLKIGAKARVAARKKYMIETHHPTDCPIKLSDVDCQVLNIIGEDTEEVFANSSNSVNYSQNEPSSPGRRLWVPKCQLDRLLSYILARPELVRNNGCKSSAVLNKEWQKLAIYVNSAKDGVVKNPQQWRRYWIGLKHKAKARIAEKKSIFATGNPANPQYFLSDFDKKIMKIMDCKAENGLLRSQRRPIDIPMNIKDSAHNSQSAVDSDASLSSSDEELMLCEDTSSTHYETPVEIPPDPIQEMERNTNDSDITATGIKKQDTNAPYSKEDTLPSIVSINGAPPSVDKNNSTLIGSTNESMNMKHDNSTPTDNPTPRQLNRKNRMRRRILTRYRTLDPAFIAQMERRRMASDERISTALETIAKASMIQAEAVKMLAQAHLELTEILKNKH